MKNFPVPRPTLFLAGTLTLCTGMLAAQQTRVSFDCDWRFTMGDAPGENLPFEKLEPWLLPTGNEFLVEGRAKPVRPTGEAPLPAFGRSAFDDSGWRRLDLPHDWGVEGPFQLELPAETGKLPWWGIGWYRKHFSVPAEAASRRMYLDLDGAMSHAAVWVNGQLAGGWPYGYASWRVDLTPFLAFGGDNVLAIRLDNPPLSSRWYPGGGIYRNVWLVTADSVHVAHWGTAVSTPIVSLERAAVEVAVTVQNDEAEPVDAQVETVINPLDKSAGPGSTGPKPVEAGGIQPVTVRIAPGKQVLVNRVAWVANPKLWSPSHPALYIASTSIRVGGRQVDLCRTEFGIRTIVFSPERGLLVNGERIPIQGVCDHHDLGALGAAFNVHALERQLTILREMGCNAIRTSHNPPAPELLDLTDRMGFLVMDEAFDCWARAKKPNDYHVLFSDWHEQDLRALVRRDRNHPSVILWSIGNEIPEQTQPEGWKLASHLAAIVREEDRTRAVTAACNRTESGYNGFQAAVDAFGYNYKPTEYPKLHASEPQLPILGSETASSVSTRGFYVFPINDEIMDGEADYQVSGYDLYSPGEVRPPDVEFRGLDEAAPYAAGEFVWTGFDYIGEPTPYNDIRTLHPSAAAAQKILEAGVAKPQPELRTPARSSYFGIIDIAGFRKDRFYLYQARWRPDLPMAHIVPHWTWPDRVGKVTPVHVYTSGDEAELFLNGQSLGRRKRGPLEYRLRWDTVTYQPGELRVVAYRNGAKWAEETIRTSGPAIRLVATVDRDRLASDGTDLAFVTVNVVDASGTLVPDAANRIHFEVTGPADVIATDNGDPTSLESFREADRAAFHGLALGIVRTRAGQGGSIVVRVSASGLDGASASVVSR